MSAELIDCSAYQSPASIDWTRVAAVGIAGVIAKATDGVDSPDTAYLRHCDGAHAAGLAVGAYHYARIRDGVQDLNAQAKQFASRYRAGGCMLLPALDFEPDGQPEVSAAVWRAFILGLAEAVTQECGVRPLIYSFPAFWRSLQPEQMPELELYPLWVATYAPAPAVMPPWSAHALWQYTSSGSVPGIPGNVDRSRAPGPIGALSRVQTPPTMPELPPAA